MSPITNVTASAAQDVPQTVNQGAAHSNSHYDYHHQPAQNLHQKSFRSKRRQTLLLIPSSAPDEAIIDNYTEKTMSSIVPLECGNKYMEDLATCWRDATTIETGGKLALSTPSTRARQEFSNPGRK